MASFTVSITMSQTQALVTQRDIAATRSAPQTLAVVIVRAVAATRMSAQPTLSTFRRTNWYAFISTTQPRSLVQNLLPVVELDYVLRSRFVEIK